MKINRYGKEGGGCRGVRKTRGWGGGVRTVGKTDWCHTVSVCVCEILTGVETSPESGLWSTQSGVRVTWRSECRDQWDLGRLPLRVFTPEELTQTER